MLNRFYVFFIIMICLCFPQSAKAEFKTFDQLDKENKSSPQLRLTVIQRAFGNEAQFRELSEMDRHAAYYIAASYVAFKVCGKPVSDGSGLAYPAWTKGALLGSSMLERIDLRQKDVLVWALIGRILDDSSPCDISELIVRQNK